MFPKCENQKVPYPSGVATTDVPLAYPVCAKAGSAIMFHQATFHGGALPRISAYM
jgi:ectoine hydroxylase-related dioxygenase (phytanoyl-CoA dioxygenase family)